LRDGRSSSILSGLEQVINDKNPSLILCVIQSPRGDVYSLIKRKLCIDRAGKFFSYTLFLLIIIFEICLQKKRFLFSVPSQVVLLKNVQKNNLSVCTKIAIQINCKIGGAPWLVTIPKKVLYNSFIKYIKALMLNVFFRE